MLLVISPIMSHTKTIESRVQSTYTAAAWSIMNIKAPFIQAGRQGEWILKGVDLFTQLLYFPSKYLRSSSFNKASSLINKIAPWEIGTR